MGPTMPPSKKAQSPSSGASASEGRSPPYRGQGEATEADAGDLSLSLSASFSKADDEELTSLSWLHESTDLLNSFSHSGLRSVSPIQDSGHAPKPPYSFSCLIFMAIEDAPNKRLPVKDIYGWILEHFPYFASAPTGWKNSVRHNLSLNKCFKKVDKDRSQSIGKGSLWSIDPEYRHNLIQALKKTPYHPYPPSMATPSTPPPTLPPTFHSSPPLWSGSPLFRKNGGVLLQIPRGVIQNGARVRSQALFPVIRPLPVNPVGSRTSAIRWSRTGQPAEILPPLCGEDLQIDHTYSTAKSPTRLGTPQPGAPSSPIDDDIIAVEIQEDVKQEPREIPLDSHITSAAYITQNALRAQRRNSSTAPGAIAAVGAGTLAGSSLPWTKNKARGISDTLPLKKRRAAALEKPESDDEEMKEAAGSLLHLAGVRACLNNITNRAAKGQKEQKDTLRN
uniref:Forkhead box protein N3 n=1 Tax=Neogobius melanostomus TaxID=47308 RepID=A0A8C6UD69_9GOBI